MAQQEDVHKDGIVARNNALWKTAQYSDMTVRCGYEEFKVHRAIVCQGSQFFATACNGQYQEAQTGVIDLRGDDPPTVRRMLKYLYNLDYDDTGDAASVAPYMLNETSVNVAEVNEQLTDTQKSLHSRLLNNITVYAIADKYDIAQLKMLAREKFESLISQHTLTPDLPLIIDAVFKTTPSLEKDLRDVAANFCQAHIPAITRNDRLSCMISNHGDLGLDMICRLIQSHEEEERRIKARTVNIDKSLTTMESLVLNAIYWSSKENHSEVNVKSCMAALNEHLKKSRDIVKDK